MLTPILALLIAPVPPVFPVVQASAATPVVAQDATPVFALRYEGHEALFVDRKDQGMLRALGLLGARLAELPDEVGGGQPPPPGAIELVVDILSGPMALDMAISKSPIEGMPFPLLANFAARRADLAGALALAGRVTDLMAMTGLELPAPAAGTFHDLPAPFPMQFGVEGSSLQVRVGSATPLPSGAPVGLLPADARLSMSGSMSIGPLMRTASESAGAGSAELEQVFGLYESIGLLDAVIEFAIGSDDSRQYMTSVLRGWAASARDMGILTDESFGLAALKTIPVDATWASASMMDIGKLLDFYQGMFDRMAPGEINIRGLASEFLGIDLDAQLLATLGKRGVMYSSDTTGSGGAMATVVQLELRDAATFAATRLQLIGQANEALGAQTEGRVQVIRRQLGGRVIDTLTFVGLPVPVEICMGSNDRHLVFGMMPQAVLGALANLDAKGPSLLDNPEFQRQAPKNLEACVAVQWVDSARLARDGYGMLGLACAAMSNGLRSPATPDREAGLILPSFRELMRDARGMVGASYVVGDDFVSVYHADRSNLVNMAGVLGQLTNGPVLALMGLGAAGGAAVEQAAEAKEIAKYEQMSTDLEALDTALYAYLENNDGAWPASIDVLITPDENGATYLGRTTVPIDPWGEPYAYEPPSEDNEEGRIFCRTNDWR